VQIRSSTTIGKATITATDGPVKGQAVLGQAAGPSSTSLAAFPATAVTNQGVSLFAAVSSATGSPSGTVAFENGGAPIAGCSGVQVTPSNLTATCQTSFGAVGSPQHLTAVFTPDAASTAPGSSGAMNLPVAPDSSSVAVTIPAIVRAGHPATYTAAVSPPASRPGPILPSGSVEFLDAGKPIGSCVAQPVANGAATCTVTYKSTGRHSITAHYGGDGNFNGATSSAVAVRVLPRRILGKIAAITQWSFYYTPTYTRVLVLVVKGAPVNARITVKCRGRGCPYAQRTMNVPKIRRCGAKGKSVCATATVDLAPAFRSRRLSVGVKITLVVSRPQWIAKYYTFTVRAGHGPQALTSCLAPGRIRPGVGCKA
jgi:hypothetical protein